MAFRIVATLLILCALSACGCEREAEKSDTTFRLEIVSVELFDATGDGVFDHYHVVTRIHGESAVQELTAHWASGTGTLVEYFEPPKNGWREDVHYDWEPHEMLLYPASVAGCDIRDGYAPVPTNLDGSFATNLNGHNLTTQAKDLELRGAVTKADLSRAIRWRIEPMADRPGTPEVDPCLLIVVNGFDHWYS